MKRYDPDQAPDPETWLSLDESRRISLVERHHRAAGIKTPKPKLHAAFHVIVENQLAEKLEPVVRAMARLTAEGLDRHDAVHAIGSVVAEHVHDLLSGKGDASQCRAVYLAAIERLTARSWRGG